jgi:hypothetical protein
MRHIKIITLSLSLVMLSVLAFVGVANAQSFKTGDTITVPANETINSMLFASGNNIDIAGIVNGDVYCAGQTVTISGTVNGDVFCAGQTISISGKVDGSVRLAGQDVTLAGAIGSSATVGAQNLTVSNNSVIGRDLLGGSQNITLNGQVMRDVVSGSGNLVINGKVGRNVKGGVETLSVGSTGLIAGNVEYIGNNDPNVSVGGKITGQVTRTTPKKQTNTSYLAPLTFTITWFVYSFMAMIALALVLAGLFPHIFEESSARALKVPGKTALVGLIGAIVVPAVIVMLLITAIGIPVAILTLLVWFIIMIISGPFASYTLGRVVLHDSKRPIWIMLSGASILAVTCFIPIIGFFTMLAAYLFGTGMILTQGKQLLLRSNKK